MSGTQLDSPAPNTGQPDAQPGKADEVSDNSEEAVGLDADDRSDDIAPAGGADALADGTDSSADRADDLTGAAGAVADETASAGETAAEDEADRRGRD